MPSPDWRTGSGYDEAVSGGRRGLAWEFLRRNPDFVAVAGDDAVRGASDDGDRVEPWGLRFRGKP